MGDMLGEGIKGEECVVFLGHLLDEFLGFIISGDVVATLYLLVHLVLDLYCTIASLFGHCKDETPFQRDTDET